MERGRAQVARLFLSTTEQLFFTLCIVEPVSFFENFKD